MKYVLLLSLIALISFSSGKVLPAKPENKTSFVEYKKILENESSTSAEEDKFIADNLPKVPEYLERALVTVIYVNGSNETPERCLLSIYLNTITHGTERRLTCPSTGNTGKN